MAQTDSLNILQQDSERDTALSTFEPIAPISNPVITPKDTIDSTNAVTEKPENATVTNNQTTATTKPPAQNKVSTNSVAISPKKELQSQTKPTPSLPTPIATYSEGNSVVRTLVEKPENNIMVSENVFNVHSTSIDSLKNSIDHQPNRIYNSDDLFLGLILLCTIGVILVKSIFSKLFENYLNIAVNQQMTQKLMRDKNVFTGRFNFSLNVIYVVVLSVFFYQLIYFFDLLPNFDKSWFVTILGIVMTITLMRYISLKITGGIFNVQSDFSEYIFNIYMFNKILGIILLPLVMFIQYVPDNLKSTLLYAGLFLIGIFYIIKLFRGFAIIIKKEVLLFYAILYLCTLEILPVLVGFRYVKGMF